MSDDLCDGLELDDDIESESSVVPKQETHVVDPSQNAMMSVWGIREDTIHEVKKAVSLYSMKHGMFAGVPLLCKGKHCAYKHTCTVDQSNRRIGQRCPMEAGAILARFESYCKSFNVGQTENVRPEEEVDLSLIRDLVDIEVQILRADNKIAFNGDFIGEMLHSVDKQGNAWYDQAVTPEVTFKYELMDKRHKILQLLNSTRKDIKEVSGNDPSVKASIIMRKVADLKDAGKLQDITSVIDIELDDDMLVNDDGSINYDVVDKLADEL